LPDATVSEGAPNAFLVYRRFKVGITVIDDDVNDRSGIATFVVNTDAPGARKILPASSGLIDIHPLRAKSSGIRSGSGDVH
jgi:hypothetical protein